MDLKKKKSGFLDFFWIFLNFLNFYSLRCLDIGFFVLELEVSPRSGYRNENIASGLGQSPRSLEVSPRRGLYPLVLSKGHSLRLEDFSMFSAFNMVGSDL